MVMTQDNLKWLAVVHAIKQVQRWMVLGHGTQRLACSWRLGYGQAQEVLARPRLISASLFTVG